MRRNSEALYSSIARGRWRTNPESQRADDQNLLPAEVWDQYGAIRADLARQAVDTPIPDDVEIYAYCEVCLTLLGGTHEVVADPERPLGKRSIRTYWYAHHTDRSWEWAGPLDEHPSTLNEIGDHEHNDDLDSGEVRFYRLHPIGPFKTRVVGTWTDAVEDLPLQTFNMWEPPTLVGINEILAKGGVDFGMSGGLECPTHRLNATEWSAILERMYEIDRFTDETPSPDLSTRGLIGWMKPQIKAYQASREARGR